MEGAHDLQQFFCNSSVTKIFPEECRIVCELMKVSENRKASPTQNESKYEKS